MIVEQGDVSMSMDMLHIQTPVVEINGLAFLESLNLQVEQGGHTVIVGDSGCGKSTLLNLIADLCTNADAPSEQNPSATMVLQEGALLDHLNVIQNLEIVARYTDTCFSADDRIGELKKLLRALNIDLSLIGAQVSQLSGGQKRRVAIVRALISAPNLLLFDEPDAGLDVENLTNLANTINQLCQKHGKACITVSHNPIYIAQVATKVVCLKNGGLTEIATWPVRAVTQTEIFERQQLLQNKLKSKPKQPEPESEVKPAQQRVNRSAQTQALNNNTPKSADWALSIILRGGLRSIRSLFHLPVSPKDQLAIAWYSVHLNLITGLVFFSLVGVMLGSTTIAIIKSLSDGALTGVVSWFLDAEDLLEMMRGRFALYLAPAIGGMLFAARSGSLVANWVGEMIRTKQLRALELLGVPTAQYLVAPNLVALVIGMMLTLLVFSLSVWLGGVLAAQYLFDVDSALNTMTVTIYDLKQSNYWQKLGLYSALVPIIVNAFAFAPKETAHQVNAHTTKGIIYSTVSIALAELLMILL